MTLPASGFSAGKLKTRFGFKSVRLPKHGFSHLFGCLRKLKKTCFALMFPGARLSDFHDLRRAEGFRRLKVISGEKMVRGKR